MFSRERSSTSAKIGAISTAWTLLVAAMVVTMFSLYERQPTNQERDFQLTSRYQYMNYY